MLFETVRVDEFNSILNYDYWTMDNEGNYLFSKLEETIFGEKINISNLIQCIVDIPFGCDTPIFIPYKELEFLSKIDIELKGKFSFGNCLKYPLVCVRGTCSKPCESRPTVKMYCFREIPCTNNRPDWNVWSCKDPEFNDFLSDLIKFVINCPNTDALIVMFNFTPNSYTRELDFVYVLSAVLVKGKQITFITDSDEIKKLYMEYNTRFPTEDREIEEVISDSENGFVFRF